MEILLFLAWVTIVSGSPSLTHSEVHNDLKKIWKEHKESEKLHEAHRKNEEHKHHKDMHSKSYKEAEKLHKEYRKNEDHQFKKELDNIWKDYKKRYWAKEKAEINEEYSRLVWEERFGRIQKFNNDPKTKYKLGLNAYSHMKHDDFVKHYNGYKSRDEGGETARKENAKDWEDPYANDVEDTIEGTEVDWREKGIISPIKNQRQCGSCWAFASTGVLEAYYAKKHKKNVSLSEQNILDCSRPEGTKGCRGGSMDDAFDYIIKSKGLMSELDYPYIEDDDESCRFDPDAIVASVKHYVQLPKGDEKALRKTVKKIGPVAVAIDASHYTFQDYQGGVYEEDECSNKKHNHAMLVVGYGTDDGVPYWLIKNSWGTSWGIDGYMKLRKDKDNHCGIASEANYPVV